MNETTSTSNSGESFQCERRPQTAWVSLRLRVFNLFNYATIYVARGQLNEVETCRLNVSSIMAAFYCWRCRSRRVGVDLKAFGLSTQLPL